MKEQDMVDEEAFNLLAHKLMDVLEQEVNTPSTEVSSVLRLLSVLVSAHGIKSLDTENTLPGCRVIITTGKEGESNEPH